MASGQSFNVYRSVDSGSTFIKTPATLPELGAKDVLLKITHSGVCATDLGYAGMGFQLALGHEGVGEVVAVGSGVTDLKIGDRAGGGFHRHSCGHCKYCLTGQDIWCYERVLFGEGGDEFNMSNGTFGDYYLGKETYLYKIPDALSSADAAPLQCAGATVYSALVDVIKPSMRVGVMGIGGLGHLAIQYAAKMGAEVVVFSTSMDKEKEAKDFGAKEFYLSSEVEKMPQPVDILVITSSRLPNWEKFATKEVFSRNGVIIPLAANAGEFSLPGLPQLFNGMNVKASLVASRQVHRDMLEFSARHGIKPVIEQFPLTEEGVNEAATKLKANKMRYRAVLVAQ
ncbi:GroES-like protein [Aulographum hederae CBS 113979]|uniref:GroES-like protein n=1 Tax=Aulographum hederae CBS 113979 TaxID=1176131 RepID=A0A6G1GI96_9PEZI|nr:GroES-like protein [Aulographum hederae CBS 113979]